MIQSIEDKVIEGKANGKMNNGNNGNLIFANMDCSWWDPENKEADGRHFTLQKMFDSVKSKLGEGQGRRALDVGAGRGRYSKLLCDKGYSVVSTDINPEMLEIIAKQGIPSERYVTNAEELPFRAEHFDVVTAMDITMHVQDTERFLGELYRVLKPSGELFVNISNGKSMYVRWTKRLNPKLRALQDDYLRKNFTPEEFKGLLNEAGFKVVDEAGHGVVSPLSLRPGWKKMIMPVGVAKYLSLGLDARLGPKYGHVIDYHAVKLE